MTNEFSTNERCEVIVKFIKIEGLINGIISQHYFGTIKMDFLKEVLIDEYFNFSLRINILKKNIKEIKKT